MYFWHLFWKKENVEIFNFILNRKKRLLYTILIGYQLFITPFLGTTLSVQSIRRFNFNLADFTM